jgi:adenosylmethionine---8-amino-7-oxononanoate aminotransferase
MLDTTQYLRMDRQSVWHPYTKRSAVESGALPIIVRGEGLYLYDTDGRRYLDAISSWWACNLGHGHPRLVEAIVRQARELQHSILGNLSHPQAIELAAMLGEFFPDERRMLFASDGASAVEAALKIALQYWSNLGHPEKSRFVALDYAYHGDTLGAVAVGFLKPFHKPFESVVFPVFQTPSPCCGTCAFGLDQGSCSQECLDTLRLILREHGHEIAAVIVEPMCQGAGGMRIYAAKFLSKLAQVCADREVLLIVDEIAVGFGRTGRMWAFEHAGIVPDLVCVGKGLSGGYLPISATIAKQGLYDTFRDQPDDHTFYHGHTFAGNPIAAACAVEALTVYREERIVERVARLGEVLTADLAPVATVPGVRNVRSLGLIGVVELEDDDQGTGTVRAARILDRLRVEGILLRPLGPVLYLMPPLIIDEDCLRALIHSLVKAVQET